MDQSLRIFHVLKVAKERTFRDNLIKKRSVGQEHCLLNRRGEILREEVGEDRCELVSKGFVVRVVMAKRNAKRASESFRREWFVKCPSEEGIEWGLSC